MHVMWGIFRVVTMDAVALLSDEYLSTNSRLAQYVNTNHGP